MHKTNVCSVAALCTVNPTQIHAACVAHKTIRKLVNNDGETYAGIHEMSVGMCDDDDKMNEVGIRIKVNAFIVACLYVHILI